MNSPIHTYFLTSYAHDKLWQTQACVVEERSPPFDNR